MDLNKLNAALTLANVTVTRISAIQNEYDHSYAAQPWYELDIPFVGRVKLGWRHRVMHLDWSFTNRELYNDHPFTTDDVTQDKTYVHVYGYAKLAEYLAKLTSLPIKEVLFLDGKPEFTRGMYCLSGRSEGWPFEVLDKLAPELENPQQAVSAIAQLKLAGRLTEDTMLYRDETQGLFYILMENSYTYFRTKRVR